MKIRRSFCALVFLCCLESLPAQAEKLEGVIWDYQPLIVEGVEVVLTPQTRLERKNHPGITPQELRIGWEVEVEGRVEGDRLLAEKIKIETERHKKVDLEGHIESFSAGGDSFDVEGRRVRYSGVDRNVLRPGMVLEGEGILVDDGTIELKKYEVRPRERDKGEVEFLALAATELSELKKNLDFYDDRLFQEYVARVGHGLVPEWVDRNEIQFNFGIVNDPELNAFALPDGTIVIHTGLLATLENEAQLATVLGHEIAHVTHKHGYRGYKAAQKIQWIALGAAVAAAAIDADRNAWEGPSWASTLLSLGATLSLTAAVNGHGRNLEDDADRIGLAYSIDAGYDPFQAPRVWEVFSLHTGDRNAVATWFFSDHSTHRARIGNLTQEINRFYRDHLDPEKLNRNQAEYARMVGRLRRHNALMDYERKELKNSETAFRAILEANPDDAVAHLYLGKILWDTQGMAGADRALAELARASELDSSLPEPYRERGFVYYSLGYRDSAIEAFQKYVEMAPNAPDIEEVEGYLRDISG
ncbi:MAG: tetratricopeptide repeat protein [Vicinamibacteria bacterium]